MIEKDTPRVLQERRLLLSLSKGDREAFHVIFTQYFDRVKYFINSVIKSSSDSEDLAQDIFVKIWSMKELMNEVNSLNAYIYRMARNSAINYTKRKINNTVPLDSINDYPVEYSTEEEYYAKEKELLIRLTLCNMPDKQRRIYEMSRDEGLSNDEISKKLEISKHTVENNISLALKSIKRVLICFSMIL